MGFYIAVCGHILVIRTMEKKTKIVKAKNMMPRSYEEKRNE
jgi:hypothetical protein